MVETKLVMIVGMWLVVLSLLAVTIQILFRAKRPLANAYVARKPLTDPEQTLYWRLKEALPECVVLSQVTFSRFMAPKPQHAKTSWALLNRIARKSVDFLVCLPDFTVVAAVELDDSSHDSRKDTQRDAILESAGIPTVRLSVNAIPPTPALRALFTRD